MKRKCCFPLLGVLLVCTAGEAAIPFNSVQTFDVAPGDTDWSTRIVSGLTISIVSPEQLDAAVQTNQVSAITNALSVTASGGTSMTAQWNSSSRLIQTRPTGVAFNVLLATLHNTSGRDLNLVTIAYDLGNPAPVPGAEDPGLGGYRVYFSFTGQLYSWSLISELSTAQPGSLAAIVWLSGWPAGAPLYLLWADDNGSPGTDSAFTIDNFIVLDGLPPPPPPLSIQPPGTNVIVSRTIRLTAVGTGFGITYQWFKDGQPIDPGLNPSAVQQTLVITNAQTSDSGGYSVAARTISGGAISSQVQVNVQFDGPEPPIFVFAYNVPDNPTGFRLSVDEPLCTDESVCGGDASSPFNWVIESIVPPHTSLAILTVDIDGTNLEFTTIEPRVEGETYRIKPADVGTGMSAIGDRFGGRMPLWYSITSAPSLLFKQGINGYTGTEDVEVTPPCSDPGCPLPVSSARILVDLDNSGAESQGLLRFNDIFGYGSNQIPPGTRIISATLTLESTGAAAGGHPVNLYRMLQPWSQVADNWNAFGNGIQADGIEAHTNVDATIVSQLETVPFKVAVDVTTSLQSWSDGSPNYGWVLLSTGSDSYRFDASESPNPPSLGVVLGTIEPPPPCSLFAISLPNSIAVAEGHSFTLVSSIFANGFCPLSLQWMKDGINIEGARSSTFSVSAATLCDAGSYSAIASLLGRSVTSNPVVVTIAADVVRPVLVGAFGGTGSTNITLNFSKAMNATSAVNAAHYVLDPPVAVIDAALSSNGRTVTLITAPRSPLTSYILRIQDLTDNRAACVGSIGNVISPNPAFVPLTGVRVDVPWDSEWLYSTNNQDATLSTPTPWYASNFSSGADWFAGPALFGTEISAAVVAQFPTPLRTPIPPNTNFPPDQITTYFRKQIDLPPLPSGATYALCHFIDDGAVFYLDGAEIGRVGMIGPPPISLLSTLPLRAKHRSSAFHLPQAPVRTPSRSKSIRVAPPPARTSSLVCRSKPWRRRPSWRRQRADPSSRGSPTPSGNWYRPRTQRGPTLPWP